MTTSVENVSVTCWAVQVRLTNYSQPTVKALQQQPAHFFCSSIFPALQRAAVPYLLPGTHLPLPCRVVDRRGAVVHTDGEKRGVSLREVEAGDAAVGADRALRVLGVANLISTRGKPIGMMGEVLL